MWQLAYLAFHYVVLAVLIVSDRKDAKNYLLLGLFGLACAFVFENITAYLGFWQYHDVPVLPLISVYNWLLYVPYLGFCYFIGKIVVRKYGS